MPFKHKTVPCKGCGRLIHFARTPQGKTIPLDVRPPVYKLTEDGRCERAPDTYVTHFATCPNADEFGSH